MPQGRRCIVVGAGLLGLSAARSLARRGWSVDVYEAGGDVGHPLSGSKGDARIFRLGYPDAHYVEMAIAARTLWRELEDATGLPLLHVTGQVSFGDPRSLDAVADALARQGEPAERLAAGEVATRFPELVVAGPALLEPASGVLVADACLRALGVARAFAVHTDVAVTELASTDNGVTVRCADGRTPRADIVVNCAGPNALGLLGDEVPPAIAAPPTLPQVAYFAARETGRVDPARLPIFIEWGDAMVYGLPVLGVATPHAGTFKVAHHTPGPALDGYDPTDAARRDLDADDPVHLTTLTDAVRRLLPGLDPVPVATERCVYDNSADTDLVLDRIGQVVIGCGTSGHGFKFGPLLGELLADLAEGATPRLDLRPFRLDRPPPA